MGTVVLSVEHGGTPRVSVHRPQSINVKFVEDCNGLQRTGRRIRQCKAVSRYSTRPRVFGDMCYVRFPSVTIAFVRRVTGVVVYPVMIDGSI